MPRRTCRMTPVVHRKQADHEIRRNIHIEKIVKTLDGKLTLEDTPVLLKEVASAVVDLYDGQIELHRAVRGYNGDAGMFTMITRIQTHLGIADDGSIAEPPPPPAEPDDFKKFRTWLGEKVMPQIVTLIIVGVLYLVFGRTP